MKNNQKLSVLFTEYPYIVAWGKMMQSYAYYIQGECERAKEENAPKDAIFFSSIENKWNTVSDIVNPGVKSELDQYLNGTKGVILI